MEVVGLRKATKFQVEVLSVLEVHLQVPLPLRAFLAGKGCASSCFLWLVVGHTRICS